VSKTYQVTGGVRAGNRFMGMLLRLGIGPKPMRLLTTVGRKSGQPRTTPVTLVEGETGRWLVAPYGLVNWVWNARAAGRVTLRRGRSVETVAVQEAPAEQAAPILKTYISSYRIVRPYFDVTPDSSIEEFAAEAPRHPVFKILMSGTPSS
jgi:deazaflavin-dependent oxidoreductase (nitroreductase family)